MTQPLFKFKPFEVTTVKTTNKNSYSKYDPYVEKQIVCNDDFMIIYEYEVSLKLVFIMNFDFYEYTYCLKIYNFVKTIELPEISISGNFLEVSIW